MLEAMNIDQAMQEQDESDKTGISLMGIKKEEVSPERIAQQDDFRSAERRNDNDNSKTIVTNLPLASPHSASKPKIDVYKNRKFTTAFQKENPNTTGGQRATVKLSKQ